MNIVIFGLGSMGKRRIRLIKKYNSKFKILGIDSNEERRYLCNKEFEIETFSSLNEVISKCKVDCAFVCTSPLSHNEIIKECLENKLNVFTELNLVADGYLENMKLAKENDKLLFLSSTFLYREEIKKINSIIKNTEGKLNYTYHVGQYLPDWHPWENYNNFFVGDKRTNGCREIFAIELPWLVEVFGKIVNVNVVKSKISSLNIEYNDNYLLIVEHESGNKGSLAVDVISRKAVRNLEVFGENLFLSWDGSPNGLIKYNYKTKQEEKITLYESPEQLETYSSFIVENAYYDEITTFFESINGYAEPLYCFEKDLEIIKIIDNIEA